MKSILHALPVVTLGVLLVIIPANSKHIESDYKTMESWSVVDRFCFLPILPDDSSADSDGKNPNAGLFSYEITMRAGSRQTIALYYDGFDAWTRIYGMKASEMSCQERLAEASHVIPLWKSDVCTSASCVDQVPHSWVTDGTPKADMVTVKRDYQFFGASSKWFFVVLANCAEDCEIGEDGGDEEYCQSAVDMHIKIDMTNGVTSNERHFSSDEIGVYYTTIVFFSFQVLLLLFALSVRSSLLRLKKYHHTVKILVLSIIVQLFSLLFSLIHYSSYSSDGIGKTDLLQISKYVFIGADTLMIVLLILLAKGWTIVRRKLSVEGRVKIALFSTTFVVVCVLAHIWELHFYDSSAVVYIYDEFPGRIIVAMRICVIVWFHYSAKTCRDNFKTKRGFYRKFTFIFTLWLSAVPLTVWAGRFIDPHYRFKLVYGMQISVFFAGQLVLMSMYNPNLSFNKSFPFHAKSSSMLGIQKMSKAKLALLRGEKLKSQEMDLAGRTTAAATGGNAAGPPENSNLLAAASTAQSMAVLGSGVNGSVMQPMGISGGIGADKVSADGKVVVRNDFDAHHFIRIKNVNDAVKAQIQSLIKKSAHFDAVLQSIEIETPMGLGGGGYSDGVGYAQMGKPRAHSLGKDYSKVVTNTSSSRNGGMGGKNKMPDPENFNRQRGGGGGGGGGSDNYFNNNDPPRSKKKYDDDWRNQFDNLKVDSNAGKILEMVTKQTSGNASQPKYGGGKRGGKENEGNPFDDSPASSTATPTSASSTATPTPAFDRSLEGDKPAPVSARQEIEDETGPSSSSSKGTEGAVKEKKKKKKPTSAPPLGPPPGKPKRSRSKERKEKLKRGGEGEETKGLT